MAFGLEYSGLDGFFYKINLREETLAGEINKRSFCQAHTFH